MPSLLNEDKKIAWFCVSSQPKHEHIAAAQLRKTHDIEVFLPRVRFKRAIRKKAAWITEALFPGYLFARFDSTTSLRRVQSTSGIRSIVHFGDSFPVIPDKIIEELQQLLGSVEIHTIPEELTPGDAVRVSEGTLRGLAAVVTQVMPGRQRVAVLMEILGQQTTVELTASALVKEGQERTALFRPLDRS